MRLWGEDLIRAARAGALLLPDPRVAIVERRGRVIRYNEHADPELRRAAITEALRELEREIASGDPGAACCGSGRG